MTSQMADRKV